MTPRLRVILSTYNHEPFLAQALDSVLAQETDFPFEVVVLEDCSTDGTRDIVLRYADLWPGRVRPVLAPVNACSNRAFMDAFVSSEAEYIAILDGDDYWTSPHKLQVQVDFLDAHPDCSMCFHNVTVEREDGTSWLFNRPAQKLFLTLDDLWWETFVAGCSPVVRRAALVEFPAWYETARFGDVPLYVLLAERGRFGYIDEVLGHYRVHAGGYWSGLSADDKRRATMHLLQTLNENLGGRYDEAVQAQVRRLESAIAADGRRAEASLGQRRWLAGAAGRAGQARRIREVASECVPAGEALAVVTLGDASLLVLDGPAAVHFVPGSDRRTPEKLFAAAPSGVRRVGWIGGGTAYEFRLRDGAGLLLAATTVTGDVPAAPEMEGGEHRHESRPPFVAAGREAGAPAAADSEVTVRWDAGDVPSASLSVCSGPVEAFLLDDVTDTLCQVERLRAQGVRHLLVPRGVAAWFRSPEIARHLHRHGRVERADESCVLYSLGSPAYGSPPDGAPPRVSVVIPCHDHARFLPDAIESAMAQTHPDVEVLVVDDGSTDETPSVAARYPGVRYVRQDNQGPSAARNTGLDLSSGPFCLFLDADDRLAPEAAAVGAARLADGRYAFASGRCTLIAPDGSPLFTPEQFVVATDHYRSLLRSNYVWNPGSVVYRRSVLEAVGGFDVSISGVEDYDVYLRIARRFEVCSHDAVVVEYRQHAGNLSRDGGAMAAEVDRLLRGQAHLVRGDAEAETAVAEGIDHYRLFYGDELLQDMRAHWTTRVTRMERELAAGVGPEEHEELIEEIRRLYRWMLQAFRLKRLAAGGDGHPG